MQIRRQQKSFFIKYLRHKWQQNTLQTKYLLLFTENMVQHTKLINRTQKQTLVFILFFILCREMDDITTRCYWVTTTNNLKDFVESGAQIGEVGCKTKFRWIQCLRFDIEINFCIKIHVCYRNDWFTYLLAISFTTMTYYLLFNIGVHMEKLHENFW